MKRRNKYRFNARSRERLYWLEYWHAHSWWWRRVENNELNVDFARACRRSHRVAKDEARFAVSADRRRLR